MSDITWVALLRGINVGRNKRVAMTDLRSLLEGLAFREVRTVLQSGNAIFVGPSTGADRLASQISRKIQADLGIDVDVVVLRAAELDEIVEGNPFVARSVGIDQLHATFVSAPLTADRLAGLDRVELLPDEFEFGTRVIYERRPNGVLASRLPDWRRVLGLTVTARNWKTILRMSTAAGG